MPPPGAPVFWLIEMPAIFPLSARSSVWVGAGAGSSAEIVPTEFARFDRFTEVASPVTTTSSKPSGSSSISTSKTLTPGGRTTS